MTFHPSTNLLDCLGWTLLHFLWQGLAIAALDAVAFWVLPRRAANLRYLTGCFAMLLMSLAPVATFYSLNRPDNRPEPKFTIQISDAPNNPTEFSQPTFAPSHTLTVPTKPPAPKTTFAESLEAVLPWFVAAWSAGVLALSCRLFAGWLLIQKLRRSATVIEPWQTKLKQLAARIGVSRPIRLLQSAAVEVPTVIGWLRPVILLPASCLIGLAPHQLESILAHELAHIRRHDYLINLLQNVVETLLFYHPAVWWVSRRIRQEREHCCDDLAVKICGDAAAYARALATLEELRPAPAQLALAAAGAPLLERIRRLAGQPERSAVRPAWPVAGVIALLLLGLVAVALRNNPASAQPAPATIATNESPKISSSSQTNAPSDPLANTPPALPEETKAEPLPVDTTSNHPSQELNGSNKVFQTFERPEPSQTKDEDNLENKSKNLPPLPQINIKTKWVEMDIAKTGTNGYAWPFDDDELKSLTNLPGKFAFSEYLIVKPTNASSPDQFIYLHNQTNPIPLAIVIGDSQFKPAIKKLEQQDGVDILTAPEVTTESGRQAQIQAVDISTVVTGGFLTTKTNGPQNFTNVPMPFGPVIDVIPYVSPDGHKIELTVIGSVTEFVGYENGASITNNNGKPFPKNWAIPHFRLRQFSDHLTVGDGQTLVYGGAPVPITQTTKTKKSFLGFSYSKKATTTTTQKVLMLFVTVTLVNPDGTRLAEASPKVNAATLVQDGKLLYESGKLDEAEAKLKAAQQTDPGNAAAWQYLRLIEEKRAADSTRRGEIHSQPAIAEVEKAWSGGQFRPNPFSRTNSVYTNAARQAILSKLNHIRLETIRYQNLPLSEVVGNLIFQAKRLDPEKTGINFLLSREVVAASWTVAPARIDPATGLPLAPFPTDANVDLSSVNINIDPALKDISLVDLLDAITKTSDVPIKYSILDYAVVFSLRDTNEPPPLEIRTFHVDPTAFGNQLGIKLTTNAPFITNSAAEFHNAVLKLFASAGVEFDPNEPAKDGRIFTYTSRQSLLLVRATHDEIAKIATALPLVESAPTPKPMETAPDAILTQLLQDQIATETLLVKLKNDLGDQHPDVQRTEKLLAEYKKASDSRVKSIIDATKTQVYTSKGRQAIMAKLNSISVPDLNYKDLPLTEVINHLSGLAKSLDPEKTGINFFISREAITASQAGAPGGIDPATGLPIAKLPTDTVAEIKSARITIDPPLKNIRLADVLDAITKTSDIPIKYSILDYAVVFSLRTAEPIPLEIRTFHVDPKLFLEGLESIDGVPFDNGNTNASDHLQSSVRRFFTAIGVDFDTNNPANVGKAFIWKDRKGLLIVRSTASDLDLLAAAIENLNQAPPQINTKANYPVMLDDGSRHPLRYNRSISNLSNVPPLIDLKVKVVKITQDGSRALGFNWTLDNFSISNGLSASSAIAPLSNSAVPPTLANPVNAPTIAAMSGILSKPQYEVVLKALEQRDGVQFLHTTQVLKVNPDRTITGVNGILTNGARQFSFYTAVDVTSAVTRPENRSIDLKIVSEIPEVANFYSSATPPADMEGNPLKIAQSEHRLSQHYTNEITVLDGQTFVFGTLYPYDLPPATSSPAKKSAPRQRPNWNVMLFVTASLINPDGTPYHTVEQRASFQANRPVPAVVPASLPAK